MKPAPNIISSKKIRNRIIITFVLAMILIISFGIVMFVISTQTAELIDARHGLRDGITTTDATVIEQNVDHIERYSFLFLSLGSVAFMGLMFNLMFSITPALRRIAFAVKEVGTGNFNYRLRLPVDNELGEIASTLNSALDKIVESEKALKQQKEAVEQIVAERTAQLKVEQAKFLASINGLPNGFILADETGHILMLNPAMGRLLELHGDSDVEFDKKVVTAGSFLKKLMRTSSLVLESQKLTSKDFTTGDGRLLHAQFSPLSVGRDLSAYVVIQVEDVTEAKILERSKDEFFSIASHELRTPLTAIKGNAALIQEYYAEQLQDEKLAGLVESIRSSSNRLINIVNDFLDVSRLEQGKIQLKCGSMDISKVVETVTQEISAVAKERKLTVTADIYDLKSLPLVYADPERVEQILYNLVGNALKFVSEGGVTIKTELVGQSLKIYVIDTGRGISAENQQLLFRKFQQANNGLKVRDITPGTGLGLYISKLLTEKMGGTIALEESVEGKGSTFSFTLPLASF